MSPMGTIVYSGKVKSERGSQFDRAMFTTMSTDQFGIATTFTFFRNSLLAEGAILYNAKRAGWFYAGWSFEDFDKNTFKWRETLLNTSWTLYDAKKKNVAKLTMLYTPLEGAACWSCTSQYQTG
ncbi:hypothetical protein BX661DRAFT_171467 [Kickxella alabastrina]|uniref:uncharacterized protein n=1 Tax=Kickxella alabastrina TaxID=61397 RepID=UPI0022210C8A|nr:uncharacterized protein BX661DRAFT_171467 [Kickxella alabastrina]KAI7826794.1 hypothetical protein BX661DRAFT_171467 [Kickxella alabastrina]